MQYGSSVATYEGVTNLEHHRRTQHVSHIRPLPGTVVHTKPIMATSTYHGLPPFKIKWAHYPLLEAVSLKRRASYLKKHKKTKHRASTITFPVSYPDLWLTHHP